MCDQVPEDLHFVLRMRHTFESLGYQSGFYLSQLFASTSSNPLKQSTVPIHSPPTAAFNWAAQKPMQSPNFQNPTRLGFAPKDETHMFLLPHSSEPQMGNMMGSDHVESDIKWPNGLSFFNALTGRSDDAKLLFNAEEGLGGGKQPDGGQNLNHDKHNPEAAMYTDVMENFLE